ncbi:CGNR zinc finger domain-containing protein [Actinopolymorpha sp. B17G11]|uniref:CGNR zinc finger domain-containing protein n=1 Tax=Actinopolymorpha sp. B17G11 TaxID=3160861 RepID=UPI0032E49281
MTTTTAADRDRGVPPVAELLCAFANTLDVDAGTDDLGDPAALTGWLTARGLVDGDVRASASDLALATAIRSGLRQAMVQHHDRSDAALAGLDEVAARLPLRLGFVGTRPRLVPAVEGGSAGVARLLVAVANAEADGIWARLKVCAASDCAWAFYDTSKNRSRHWCSMGVCGNRQKTRAYRARQRAKD